MLQPQTLKRLDEVMYLPSDDQAVRIAQLRALLIPAVSADDVYSVSRSVPDTLMTDGRLLRERNHLLYMSERGQLSSAVIGRLREYQMGVANMLIHGFGVEAVDGAATCQPFWRYTRFLYVNLGDTYTTTIVYRVRDDRFLVAAWGDLV